MRNRPLVWAWVTAVVAMGLITFSVVGRPGGDLAELLQIGMGLIFIVLMAAKHHLDQKALELTNRQRGSEAERGRR